MKDLICFKTKDFHSALRDYFKIRGWFYDSLEEAGAQAGIVYGVPGIHNQTQNVFCNIYNWFLHFKASNTHKHTRLYPKGQPFYHIPFAGCYPAGTFLSHR